MSEVVAAFPPATVRARKSSKWIDIVEQVKQLTDNEETEGWAYVGEYSPGVATHIRRGKYKQFLPDDLQGISPEVYMSLHWEVTTRKTGDGWKNAVYIRWIG